MAKYINSGITSSGVTLNVESMYVSSGGTASQTVVNENGQLHISNGGIASQTTVNKDGELHISGGGIAFDTTVNQYGWVEVLSGGTATRGDIKDGGWFEVFPGGTAIQIRVSSGGVFYVSSGGTASDTVFAGGSGATVNNGGVFVKTSIGMGGMLGILHGGTAKDVHVASNGTFYVSEGAKLTGSMTFEDGAFVAFFDGPTLDFDITGRKSSDPPLVNNLSLIKGTPQYTLTVDGSELSGTYKLAGGVSIFNQTISVKNTSGAGLGSLTFDGALSTEDADYTLSLVDGTLSLVVASKFVDTVPPVVSNVAQDKTDPTNQSVTVTATFTDNIGVTSVLYKIGKGGWLDYPDGGVVVTENATIYFKAVDEAGNESEIVSHEVTNIYKGDAYGLNHSFAAAYDLGTDSSIKSANAASIATAHEEDYFTFKLTQKATVTMTTSGPDSSADTVLYLYDGDQLQIAYDDDSGSDSYSSLSKVLNPGTYYVKVIAYGDWTIDDYDLSVTVGAAPVDKEKPVVSNVKADTTNPTHNDVFVTADFTDDYLVESKLYRIGDGAWLSYPDGGVTVKENATVYFMAIDAGGVESDIVEYTVSNIDRIAPTIEVTPSTTKPTPSVLLTASFSDNMELISARYKIDDGDWKDYKPGGVTVTENCDVLFMALDAAGNESVTNYKVVNIDKDALKGELDDGSNDYLYDKTNGWNDSNISVSNTVTGNGELNLDKAGTVDMRGMHNMFGNDGTNTDAGDVAKLNLAKSAKLTFTIDSTAAGTFYVYEDGFDKKGNRTQITVGKVAVKAGKTATLKDVCLTGDGTYYVAMVAKNVKKAGTEGYYNVNVSDSTFFADADNGNNNEAATAKAVSVGRSTGAIVLDKSALTGSTEFKNFVGFGDSIDYAKINLAASACLRFSLTGEGDGTAKFTIWKYDTAKDKMSKVGGVTALNAKNQYAAATKAQFLDSNNGQYEYYVSMECSDAAKGKGVYYNVAVADGAVFFDSADDGRNNILYDKKAKAFYGEDDDHHFVSTNVGVGTKTVKLDGNAIGEAGYANFVGYGDAVDYAKINLTGDGSLYFKLKATGDATFVVYKKGQDKKGRDTLVTLQTTKLKLAKGSDVIDKFTDVLSDLAAGEYYISMTAKNTKANDKGLVYYNVTATLELPDADALAMPETDNRGVSDALSFGQNGADLLADAAAVSFAELDGKAGRQNLANLA